VDPMDTNSAMTTSMTVLPAWLRLLTTTATAMILLLHTMHLRHETGLWRWWHSCHIAMTVGMIAMYADPVQTTTSPSPLRTGGLIVYLALAASAAVTLTKNARRHRRLDIRWIATTTGLLAMALMFTPMPTQSGALGTLAVVYLLGEAAVWLTAHWWQPTTELVTEVPVNDQALAWAGGPPRTTRDHHEVHRIHITTVHTPLDVRLSLAVMALGMAGMLAAM
jgi:hypothetical protein